ncbi:MAG: transporter permease, partial [Oscillospiraceae bacterium]|nr:transporter permease [Oscillospiraceae bacterium]
MYIFKNALKNISRSKGRNILIGIIVLVIATSSCVALSIKKSAAKAEETGLSSLSVTAQVSVDRQALMEKAQSEGTDMREFMTKYQDLSLDEMQKYAKSQYVKDFIYTVSSSINASGDLEPYDTSSDSTSGTSSSNTNSSSSARQGQQAQGNSERGQFGGGMMGSQGDFTIKGFSSESAMTDFVNGTSAITDGAIFEENTTDLACIINENLASLNGLKVGDKITLANPNDEDETYQFKITGIYATSASSATGGMRFSTSTDPANQIYTSYAALNTIVTKSTKNATTETDEDTGRT